ncbi:hypothetical protein JOC34_000596 [Virgibacillus halotolerans]|uniref:hypothetical protein n=1 Tax=Virgibacillus halotolerans TaxID=1071053 RepID=UPI001961B784|nr:hypothetical protein [Virgibacillus halotolerans]MBM7598239.1 hypothetical protein [Virgibacillus halotolerans]
MKSFDCTVERIDKYIVEFDTDVINEEWMEEFREFMYDFYTLEEHAEHIAQHRARFGGKFIEGYGFTLENGKTPYWADEDRVNKSINIKIISDDNEAYVDIK